MMSDSVKYWEIIVNKIIKAGFSEGGVSGEGGVSELLAESRTLIVGPQSRDY
jgi:hypothetical protein